MRNLHLMILVLALSLSPFAAQAAPADLSETGQTICYAVNGTPLVSCTGTGQDGELRAGVAWPAPRFTVGTGTIVDCVTDNLTGLMWVKAPSTVTATWPNALTSANNLTLCGFSDWRLPNVNELRSLVHIGVDNTAAFLNAQGFSGVQSFSHWSSSSSASTPSQVWLVDMHSGRVSTNSKMTGSNHVWPVRAGQ